VPDETDAPEVKEAESEVSWLDEHVELDLTGHGPAHANGGAAEAPRTGATSERAGELEGDHWRERAVIWRERALAAELVAKMLQRNLDDLRANLEDLRREAKAVAAAQELEAAPNGTGKSMTPWRRFVRDLYDKYLR
jgi:hypothetical protein